jgi:coproporphyrinogen III oxidase
MTLTEADRQRAVHLFRSVQTRLAQAFEDIDGEAKVQRKSWERVPGDAKAGGGTIGVIRGQVVEKAGANVSVVTGDRYPAIEGEHKDKPYFAAGISTITHMMNPHAPIAHMNVRLLEVGDTFWVGGGADLTPFQTYAEDTEAFHDALRQACAARGPGTYEQYKKWCDEYFYIPHRKEARGVGGIFFDYLKGEPAELLAFLDAVSSAYVRVYPAILKRRKDTPYTPELKEAQLYWRARYAEFNLVYDRGTKFGLMTGGNIEAIFVSMPPVVKW